MKLGDIVRVSPTTSEAPGFRGLRGVVLQVLDDQVWIAVAGLTQYPVRGIVPRVDLEVLG